MAGGCVERLGQTGVAALNRHRASPMAHNTRPHLHLNLWLLPFAFLPSQMHTFGAEALQVEDVLLGHTANGLPKPHVRVNPEGKQSGHILVQLCRTGGCTQGR